jgi:hypothetical protein
MLKYITSILLLCAPFISWSQEKAISIRLLQRGVEVPPQNGIVSLDRKPFTIEVKLTNVDGVYLYAGFTDSIYRTAHNEPIPGYAELADMAMAEDEFNKDQELLISSEGWSYWFYDRSMNWHRFDKAVMLVDSETVIATKTIRQFNLIETHKLIKTERAGQPLYLFFVVMEPGDEKKELERYKLIIHWK